MFNNFIVYLSSSYIKGLMVLLYHVINIFWHGTLQQQQQQQQQKQVT